MEDEDFQQRLQRIAANAPQAQGAGAQYSGMNVPKPERSGRQKPSFNLLAAGGGVLGFGSWVVRHANSNYQAWKDGGKVATALGMGAAGLTIVMLGVFMISRAVTRRLDTPTAATASHGGGTGDPPVRKGSNWARVLFSLLGFVFGVIAFLYMFASAAARSFDTERAHLFTVGAVVMACGFAIVALLFGIVGLFLRGRGLGRVPVYFVFGAVLTYSVMWISHVNMAEWPQFAAQMQ